MRYCGRCWKERKGWLPDRPKPKHKKAARNSKEASGSRAAGGSSSNRNKNKRTEGQAVKSSTRAVSSPTPEAAEPEANTSLASGSSEGPSEGPSGSSQETLPDSGYSQSQELFSPNEEEEQRQDGKSLPPGFVDKRSRTIATSRYVTTFLQFCSCSPG